mmetsp:Transcript_3248/g.7212  ORF Transcript_3248/g.7212 Transcript_3248/m.7212 type:complete len:196 (-) Transcript_3248:186-773(-)
MARSLRRHVALAASLVAMARGGDAETWHANRRLLTWTDEIEGAVTCKTHTDPGCGSQGVCSAETLLCVCTSDYYTTQDDAARGVACATRKKSRTTAMLLHLFLGWSGAGAFFAGWVGFGLAALLLCLGTCGLWSLCACTVAKREADLGPDSALALRYFNKWLISCCCCVQFVLWITGIILIADVEARDADSVPLG